MRLDLAGQASVHMCERAGVVVVQPPSLTHVCAAAKAGAQQAVTRDRALSVCVCIALLQDAGRLPRAQDQVIAAACSMRSTGRQALRRHGMVTLWRQSSLQGLAR